MFVVMLGLKTHILAMGYSSTVNWKAVKEFQERFNYIEEPLGQTTNVSAATEKTTEDDFLS